MKSQLSTWSLLIFTIGLASGQSNNANCSLAGQCLESLFITEATTANAQGCLEECKENQACQWFTYKPANDVCDLFKTCGYVSNENCPDCLSGQKECDSVYKCNISGRCQVRGAFNDMNKRLCHNLMPFRDCLIRTVLLKLLTSVLRTAGPIQIANGSHLTLLMVNVISSKHVQTLMNHAALVPAVRENARSHLHLKL